MKTLAEQINAFEFDHVFTLHPDGSITEPDRNQRENWAPEVYNSDEGIDIDILGEGWRPIVGLTGQYGYHGAVMHASEYIGRGIADYMLEMVTDSEEPVTFCIVVVECYPEDDDPEPEPAGWAILYRGT